MKYAILLYADESLNDESPEMMERWNAFTEDTHVQGVFSAGEALWPVAQATTVCDALDRRRTPQPPTAPPSL